MSLTFIFWAQFCTSFIGNFGSVFANLVSCTPYLIYLFDNGNSGNLSSENASVIKWFLDP